MEPPPMIELLRTNDVVLISIIEAMLRDEGVFFFVADQNMSVLEGSAGFLQRRICVPGEQAEKARTLLVEAGFGPELTRG
jgi:phosphatidylinositol kinase/protein kinase (PI-3  family)